MVYTEPTIGNVITSIDNILKKEHDKKIRAKTFLALSKVMEEDFQGFKLALFKHIDELLSK